MSHAFLSASGSKKWLNCPASARLESKVQEEEKSYSKEGTIAHALGELELKLYFKMIDLEYFSQEKEKLKKEISDLGFDLEEIEGYVADYRDYVIDTYETCQLNSNITVIDIESRVDYSNYAKDGFGTSDVIILSGKIIHIIDLKYGKGVRVSAENNSQLMLYALGALKGYDIYGDIESVNMTIFQPRMSNNSTFTMSAADLINWGETVVKPKAELALNKNSECIAGTHCKEGFCKVRGSCKAFTDYHLQLEKYRNSDINLISSEEYADIIERGESLKSWIDEMKKQVVSKLLKGDKVPGLKLVNGRTSKSFTDEDAIKKILKGLKIDTDLYISSKLKSVTSIEKIFKQHNCLETLQDLIIYKEGSPTLVKDSDSRLEYNSAKLDFSDVTV